MCNAKQDKPGHCACKADHLRFYKVTPAFLFRSLNGHNGYKNDEQHKHKCRNPYPVPCQGICKELPDIVKNNFPGIPRKHYTAALNPGLDTV